MKNRILIFTAIIFLSFGEAHAQMSCSEIMQYVKSESYGNTYYSFDSEAISQVTFHEITDKDYNTFYFAIVNFTSSYNDYIYQVSSTTESNYSMNYLDSAGKAFWQYIQPNNENLGCAQ